MNTAAGIMAGLYDFNDTDIPKPYWQCIRYAINELSQSLDNINTQPELIEMQGNVLVNEDNKKPIYYNGQFEATFRIYNVKIGGRNKNDLENKEITIKYNIEQTNIDDLKNLIREQVAESFPEWNFIMNPSDGVEMTFDIEQINKQPITITTVDIIEEQAKGINTTIQPNTKYRNPIFNNDFTEIHQQTYPYVEIFDGNFITKYNECYEIVYKDLGLPIPEKQTPKDLIEVIYENQDKLNYCILNDISKTRPTTKYNRQVFISLEYMHIWISKSHKNLIKSKIIPKDMEPVYITQQELQDTYNDMISKNIIPYYKSGQLLYCKNLYYKVKQEESQLFDILNKFQCFKSQRLIDYIIGENVWSQNNNIPSCVYDFNRCYSSLICNLPRIQVIQTTTSYNNEPIQNYLYYHITNVQIDSVKIQSLIITNYIKGTNIKLLQKLGCKFEIDKVIVPTNKADNPMFKANPYDYDKEDFNKAIGLFTKRDKEDTYRLHTECIHVPSMTSHGDDYDLSFLHCQMLNLKMFYILYFLPIDKITYIFKDAIGFDEEHTELLDLKYIDTDRPIFKREIKKQQDIKNSCWISKQKFLNNKLVQAFAGAGKTFYCRSYLKNFRETRRYLDQKCLVLVAKLNNIKQYLDFIDVAEIKTYQEIKFISNYKCLKSFDTILLDEVYMMDAKFVFDLYNLSDVKKVFVGDVYQHISLGSSKNDYEFLNNCNDYEKLQSNYRNNFDYQKLLSNFDLLKQVASEYMFDVNELENYDEDTVYITLTNKDALKINKLYRGSNVIVGSKTKAKYITDDCTLDENNVVRNKDNKPILNYYGNSITCYRCQGLQWKNIKIEKKVFKDVENLYVALSRLQK